MAIFSRWPALGDCAPVVAGAGLPPVSAGVVSDLLSQPAMVRRSAQKRAMGRARCMVVVSLMGGWGAARPPLHGKGASARIPANLMDGMSWFGTAEGIAG